MEAYVLLKDFNWFGNTIPSGTIYKQYESTKENLNNGQTAQLGIGAVIASFLSRHSYFAKHLPTGEDWYILGIDEKGDRVCAAGWPATIGKLSDCENLEVNKPLTDSL